MAAEQEWAGDLLEEVVRTGPRQPRARSVLKRKDGHLLVAQARVAEGALSGRAVAPAPRPAPGSQQGARELAGARRREPSLRGRSGAGWGVYEPR